MARAGLILISFLAVGPGNMRAQTSTNSPTIAIEALSRLKGIDLDKNPAIKSAVFKVLEQTRGTERFVAIVCELQLKDQEEGLLGFVYKYPASTASADAMRLILSRNKPSLLQAALSTTNAAGMVLALGNTAQNEIIPFLEPIVRDMQRQVSIRKAAIESLSRVEEGCRHLLKIAAEPGFDLSAFIASVLQTTRWEVIRESASKFVPAVAGAPADSTLPISEWAQRKGDPDRGKEVFRRETVGCAKCHVVNGEGTDFGPALSEIGTKLGKDALYEAILNPSAGIAVGFEAWRIELKDDNEVYGMLVSETSDELIIKSPGGILNHVKKSEITRRTQQKVSAMPAGLAQLMTSRELVDLVEYLSGLKKANGQH
jgi:putative heme-binding domain-containing protein